MEESRDISADNQTGSLRHGGVHNFADDLIVFGEGDEEHDRNLYGLIRRVAEENLTLNLETFYFRIDKVVFKRLLVVKLLCRSNRRQCTCSAGDKPPIHSNGGEKLPLYGWL